MGRKFSNEDAIRFLYGEMDAAEQEAFLDALIEDEELFGEVEALKNAKQTLSPLELSPSKASTDRILYHARKATRDNSRKATRFVSTGRERVINFHHLVSVAMVLFTCVMVGAAMFAYQKATNPDSKWEMTDTKVEFEDAALDDRLDFARQRLQAIIDDRKETVVPVHHDTYRLVNTDLFAPEDRSVVFLNIK